MSNTSIISSRCINHPLAGQKATDEHVCSCQTYFSVRRLYRALAGRKKTKQYTCTRVERLPSRGAYSCICISRACLVKKRGTTQPLTAEVVNAPVCIQQQVVEYRGPVLPALPKVAPRQEASNCLPGEVVNPPVPVEVRKKWDKSVCAVIYGKPWRRITKPICSGGGARRILLAPTHYSGRCFCQETNAMPTPSTWCLLLYVPMSNNRNTRRRRAPHRPKATAITASWLGWRGEQLKENAPFQLELCHDGVYEREASSGLLPCRQLFLVLVPRYLPANISTCGETQKMRLNPYRGIYYCKNDHTNSK